jgi:signal transduction histidine kinase
LAQAGCIFRQTTGSRTTDGTVNAFRYRRLMRELLQLARRTAGWSNGHPTAADAGLAVCFEAASLVSMSATFETMHQDPAFVEPAKPPLVLALLAVTLPLAFRRRFPVTAAAAVIGAFVVGRIVVAPDDSFLGAWESVFTVWACWLALYSAVVHRRTGLRFVAAIAVLVALLLAEIVRELYFVGSGFGALPLTQAFQLAYNAVFVALPLGLGAAVRALRERECKLQAQAAELERQREVNARRAVLDERVRISRELHDVVAHHVSVMGVQAAAARRVMARQPAHAEQALASIEDSSRQAVVELQRLLGILRRPEHADGLAPQPDLAQLPDLVARARSGEFTVDLEVEGEPRPLLRSLEVSAYRVVQEALTNALKHSGGTTAKVRVSYRPSVLEVEVVDDGRGALDGRTAGGGHGLIGMRERITLHGGHLRAGPLARGGFEVHAAFPLNGQDR